MRSDVVKKSKWNQNDYFFRLSRFGQKLPLLIDGVFQPPSQGFVPKTNLHIWSRRKETAPYCLITCNNLDFYLVEKGHPFVERYFDSKLVINFSV